MSPQEAASGHEEAMRRHCGRERQHSVHACGRCGRIRKVRKILKRHMSGRRRGLRGPPPSLAWFTLPTAEQRRKRISFKPESVLTRAGKRTKTGSAQGEVDGEEGLPCFDLREGRGECALPARGCLPIRRACNCAGGAQSSGGAGGAAYSTCLPAPPARGARQWAPAHCSTATSRPQLKLTASCCCVAVNMTAGGCVVPSSVSSLNRGRRYS